MIRWWVEALAARLTVLAEMGQVCSYRMNGKKNTCGGFKTPGCELGWQGALH